MREADAADPLDFDEFVVVELPRLLGLARALSRDDHDAWDLVQETLARIGTRWSRLGAGHDAAAYARTVLVRLNIDRLRRLRREWPTSRVREEPAEPPALEGVDPWLATALDSLTPRQRTVIVLRFAEDLDLAGIADRMGCSVGTVKSHLSRGLERLRHHAPSSLSSTAETKES